MTKTPSWEPYNPSNEPITSFELDIYNEGDVFDNTNDYMDGSYDENDSEGQIDQESPSKADKDADYADESGTEFGTFECPSSRNP